LSPAHDHRLPHERWIAQPLHRDEERIHVDVNERLGPMHRSPQAPAGALRPRPPPAAEVSNRGEEKAIKIRRPRPASVPWPRIQCAAASTGSVAGDTAGRCAPPNSSM